MKQNPRVFRIGLTGGIASGKSTVSQLLIEKGYRLLDADRCWHQLIQGPGPAADNIRQHFGDAFIRPDGGVDRKALSQLVYHDPKAMERLNRLSHPLINSALEEKAVHYEEKEELKDGFLFFDLPLLFEADEKRRLSLQRVITVYLPEEEAVRRLAKREGIRPEEACRRVEAQLGPEEKRKLADYCIDNQGSIEDLRGSLNRVLEALKKDLWGEE